jgi:hypothetical protein
LFCGTERSISLSPAENPQPRVWQPFWCIKANNLGFDPFVRRKVCEELALYLRRRDPILFGDWTVKEKIEMYLLVVLIYRDSPQLRRYLP